MSFHRWGFVVGRLNVAWFDLWAGRPCFELGWTDRMGWAIWRWPVARKEVS